MGVSKPVDWKIVDELLEAGCMGTEIAPRLGICAETLYLRCQADKNKHFTVYAQEKRACGDVLLKKKQFDKALGIDTTGDNTLLIWLGKTRLGQKEDASQSENMAQLNQKFDQIVGIFCPSHKEAKDVGLDSSKENIDCNSTSNDKKS